MILISTTHQLFTQLKQVLAKLNADEFTAKSKVLSGATVGQHLRHIIELYIELQAGYINGTIHYENRKRDVLIETDISTAQHKMDYILNTLNQPNKPLQLKVSYDVDNESTTTIETNYFRELVYNVEHTVHHMALLRIGINEVCSIELPENFGVAVSTIKFRQACVQ